MQEINRFKPKEFRDAKKSICVVSSCGGHLVQALQLYPAYRDAEVLFVVNDRTDYDDIMRGRTLRITHAERNWKQILNIIEAFWILFKYRPKVLLSTGAAPAVPFSLIAKYLLGTKIIFVESFSRVTGPSATGRLMYFIADKFYVQWESLQKKMPRAKFVGSLL